MDALIAAIVEYGSLGIVVAGCFYYIVLRDNRHAQERSEWLAILKDQENKSRELLDKQQDELLAVLKETNSTNGDNAKIITEMSTNINNLLQKQMERREKFSRGRNDH